MAPVSIRSIDMTGYELPEEPEALRAVLSEKLQSGVKRMDAYDGHLATLKDEVWELKEASQKQDERLERIEKNTATLVDIFQAGDGTLKTAKWFGKLLIWIGGLSSALYALWYAILNWPQKGG